MPTSTSDLEGLRRRAIEEGFSSLRITAANLAPEVAGHLVTFVDNGYAGDMDWLAETGRRSAPTAMWPEATSAIIVSLNYGQDLDAFERLKLTSTGVISIYALNKDYHDIIKPKLKRLAAWFAKTSGHEVKVFVDTAPLMEKPLAAKAGLGWQGKHTNLVSREFGSWFFLGVILTTAALPHDAEETDHCGSCRACLDICPTKAFPAPHQLDARRCISYLTIEHKGHIAHEFRRAMGNRIYGCDDCLAICPWNKFAQTAHEAKLKARADLIAPSLAGLLGLDDAVFRHHFAGSPVKRIGRARFIRNCLIAAGNSGDASLLPAVISHLKDGSVLVRAMAVWALKRLADDATIAQHFVDDETDCDVRGEWRAA